MPLHQKPVFLPDVKNWENSIKASHHHTKEQKNNYCNNRVHTSDRRSQFPHIHDGSTSISSLLPKILIYNSKGLSKTQKKKKD